jgi:predicted acyltransferase
MTTDTKRIYSIDVFRALTMMLMIFVNDLWSMKGIPVWLEHAEANQDFLGLADVVFPCFLFIVGMSIPYAIQNRLAKGESKIKILIHIVLRSLALLVMGFFTVNISDLNVELTGISRHQFQILIVAAFFLIWNLYPKSEGWKKWLFRGLQLVGIAILFLLFFNFKGGKDGLTGMTPQWWGILGLIGWTYLISATIYLFASKRNWWLIAAFLFFSLLNIADHAGWLKMLFPGGPGQLIPGNGAFHAFAFYGIIATLILEGFTKKDKRGKLPLLYLSVGILLILLGFVTRNFFIISKIQATPTWVLLCSGIAFALFALVYWLDDMKGKAAWFDIIKPAGTSTLTCYLIPYLFAVPITGVFGTGILGLTKSMLYAFLIVGITWFLGKMKIRLNI